MPPSNDNIEANEILMEQVASHNTMIQELNKSVAAISSDIKVLQLQAVRLEKDLSKLADNQATLLSISAGKPHAPSVVGVNYINIYENVPITLEETLNELLNYPEYLLPFISQLVGLEEEVNETEYDESIMLIELERKVGEVKMLSEVKEPLLYLENCSLYEIISILQNISSDPSINVNQVGFGSYIANHV